jgi:Type VI secretion system/phage-baseplate injector OB domain
MLRLAIVTDNQDPDNLRRVRVVSADRGISVSDWIGRVTGYCDKDDPVAPIGSTVIVGTLEGGKSDEVVLGVLQTTGSNPPLNKPKLSDEVTVLYGNRIESATNDWQSISENVQIQTATGTSIHLNSNGQVTISNSGGTGLIVIQPNGAIEISSPLLSWNGERVAVVGGVDSDGDTTLR